MFATIGTLSCGQLQNVAETEKPLHPLAFSADNIRPPSSPPPPPPPILPLEREGGRGRLTGRRGSVRVTSVGGGEVILTSEKIVRLPEPEPMLQVFHPGFRARLVMLGHATRTFWTYPSSMYVEKTPFHKKKSKNDFSTIWQILQRFAILSELSEALSSPAPITP
jgi:hypothetical protein